MSTDLRMLYISVTLVEEHYLKSQEIVAGKEGTTDDEQKSVDETKLLAGKYESYG